jgi:hypothetical protein
MWHNGRPNKIDRSSNIVPAGTIFPGRVRIGKYSNSRPVLRHTGEGLGGPYKFLSELGLLRRLRKGPFLFPDNTTQV